MQALLQSHHTSCSSYRCHCAHHCRRARKSLSHPLGSSREVHASYCNNELVSSSKTRMKIVLQGFGVGKERMLWLTPGSSPDNRISKSAEALLKVLLSAHLRQPVLSREFFMWRKRRLSSRLSPRARLQSRGLAIGLLECRC
jgi:hypothetical protein